MRHAPRLWRVPGTLPVPTMLVLVIALALSGPARAEDELTYNRDIRPILAEHCFACHGPDSAARKADLRLDQRDQAVASGAIVPGQAAKSTVMERILSDDPEQVMPPPATRKVMTAQQKETLRKWLDAGAIYQPHWSLIPPQQPALPAVKNAGWVSNPIDQFILAELEKKGLSPAPEADRRALARRVCLDLTGLPPAVEVVEAYLADSSDGAYERYVDRLLSSPRWGEHRGRYWLDVARFADTHGIHFDNYREIWAYRDWVIQALNRNQSFQQFAVEQIAGDLLPNRTLEQQVASGFNRCNITTSEGGTIPEEYLVLYTRDRTETVSQAFLGLTANCSVCHDHKFDRLSQREFYEMAAFFNNTTQPAMDGNAKDTPPIVVVPSRSDRVRWEALTQDIPAAQQQIEARRQSARQGDFTTWLGTASADSLAATVPTEGIRVQLPLTDGKIPLMGRLDGQPREFAATAAVAWEPGHVGPQALKFQPGPALEMADLGDLERDQPFSFGAWVKLPKDANGAIFARMDDPRGFRGWDLWVQQGRVGTHLIHAWPDDALKVVAKTPVKENTWTHVLVTYDGSSQASGVKVYVNGQGQETTIEKQGLKNSIRTTVPFKLGQRHEQSRLEQLVIQDIRIYGRTLSADEASRLASGTRTAWLASKPAAERSEAETDELFQWWLPNHDKVYQDLKARLAALEQEQSTIKSRGTIAHVMQEKSEEAMAYVLFRGEYDKRRDPVKPDTPDNLPPMPNEWSRNRLSFAQWLFLPEQPLTARVTVNRFWQEVFGTGIVRTAGDFGVSGELPSHPELLDWLAIDFRNSGWDIKRFFKQLVMSSTYRQAAIMTPEKLEKDPQNRWLSRGPRFRMDGEMIRDYVLASSGMFVELLGGPSVKPYQPEGVWEAVAMIGSNTRDYRHDSGRNLYRRSMYTFWKRSAPPAALDIFNAPSRETCVVRRERTNTPLQALVTLNDPQSIEAARYLAEQAVQQGGDSFESRGQWISARLLGRPLQADELVIVKSGFDGLLAHYQGQADAAKKLLTVGEYPANASLDPAVVAAWTMTINELFNLDEVLNK